MGFPRYPSQGRHDEPFSIREVIQILRERSTNLSITHNFTIGSLVKHFTYDGLGRLVRVQSPWPNPQNANGGVRSERFYYDGARRIQEMVTDPLGTIDLVEGTNPQGENLSLGTLMNQTVAPEVLATGDGSANPMSFESGQLNNPEPIIGIGGDPLPEPLSGIEREYVWGPGDNGLDEILVQYDIYRAPWWMIQDGGGDVVAMCDLGSSGGTARVVSSWQYDAYGQCLRASAVVPPTSNYPIPMNRIGHKGLFMDRLDVGLTNYDPVTGAYTDNPRLEPFSTVLYQNRNRTYSPQLGRFIQRDPNETGQLYAAFEEGHGCTPLSVGVKFALEQLYRGRGSLHEYLNCNPNLTTDPMGLFTYLDALETGLQMADNSAEQIGAGFNAVLMGLGLILMTDEYYAAMDVGADWATDWAAPDDAYARSAEWAQGIGFWADEEEGEGSSAISTDAPALAGYHDHHGFPQEFRAEFAKLGIDIEKRGYKAWLKDRYHLQVVHGRNRGRPGGAFNKFWDDFLNGKKGTVSNRNAISKLKTIRLNGWRIPRKWR